MVFCPPDPRVLLFSTDPRKVGPPIKGKALVDEEIPRVDRSKVPIDNRLFESITLELLSVAAEEDVPFDLAGEIAIRAAQGRPTLQESKGFAASLTRAYLDAQLFILFGQADRPGGDG